MMKMNLILAALVAASVSFAAETNSVPEKSPVPGVSDAEWATLPPKERLMRAVGGMIPNKTTAVGNIAIVDAQDKVSPDFLRKRVNLLESVTWMRVNYVRADGGFSLAKPDEVVRNSKGNVAVVVADLPGLPRVMALPESKAAVVNVAALADGADAAKLESRTAKELSRAFAYAFGVTRSERPGVLDEVSSLKDLDEMLVDVFTQDVAMEIERASEKYGIRRYGRIMYKTACERGIAPPPANKWQQRVWDESKKMPEKPMKIEFDPAKGR